MKTILASCLILFAFACAPIQPQPTPAFTCATACAHGTALDCDWARWNPEAGSCVSQCFDWVDTWGYDMQCMTTAATCEAAEGCQGHTYGVHRLSPKK